MPRTAYPTARPTIFASASGELNTRSEPNSVCKPGGQLENPALAFDLVQSLFAAGIGHIFAVHDDARIAPHLVLQADVDQVRHRPRRAALGRLPISPVCRPALVLSRTPRAVGSRSSEYTCSRDARQPPAAAPQARVRRPRQPRDPAHVSSSLICFALRMPSRSSRICMLRNRIAHGISFALRSRAVQLVIVGQRMRIRPDAMAVHKRRS